MNKLSRTILIAVLGWALLFGNPLKMQAAGIVITPNPVFNVGDFKPGDSVASVVTITNNSGKNYTSITLGGTAVTNEANFASALELKVGALAEKNLGVLLAGGTLDFGQGINNGETKTFNFTMRFKEGGATDNQYQNKSLVFSFIFTFGGEEQVPVGGGVIDRGGSNPPLIIFDEQIPGTEQTNATITWKTNFPATSRIIYSEASQSHLFDSGSPPNYGYANSTVEDSALVTFRTVVLNGLKPATTYFIRLISNISPFSPNTITEEMTFTTKGVAGKEIVEEEVTQPGQPGEGQGQGTAPGQELPPGQEGGLPAGSGQGEGAGGGQVEGEGVVGPEKGPKEERFGLSQLTGAIGDIFSGKNCCSGTSCCLILTILLTILAIIFGLMRKKRSEEEENKKKQHYLDLIVAIIALIVLNILLKCWTLIIPVIILIAFLLKQWLDSRRI